jgi:hypothetical protein
MPRRMGPRLRGDDTVNQSVRPKTVARFDDDMGALARVARTCPYTMRHNGLNRLR